MCEVISHCGFDLHFSDDERCWASFQVSVGYLYVFFEEIPIHVFCPFLIGLFVCLFMLSCISSLCILDTNLYSDMWFAYTFSPSVGCLLVLLIVSLAVQRLICFYFLFFNIYFFFGRVQAGQGQREGADDLKQSLCWQADSSEPDVGFEPMNREIMT